MLNPNQNRLDYGKILAPPAGCQLDFAVGTTYSLNLDALVGACIALGLAEDTDSELMNNPICLLEALRSTGDKVALFCESGQIHMPRNVTALYILLEKMVYQATVKGRQGITKYPSFHSKFWLLRYQRKDGELLYRVIALSRNLTFDRSWDVCFYMDGEAGGKTDKNEPVADFLRYLCSQLPKSKAAKEKDDKICGLIKELAFVNFTTGSKEFYDYEFLPSGVPDSKGGFYSMLDTPLIQGENDINKKPFHELLVISPFLSNDIIRQFNSRYSCTRSTERVMITRARALGRLRAADCDKFKIYVMKDAVVDGERVISEGEGYYQKQDIHAKVFLLQGSMDTELYLGSMNASHNAVYGNVEFMIRLKSKKRHLNLHQLLDAIFDGPEDGAENPFIPVTLDSIVEDEEEAGAGLANTVIKQIVRCSPWASIRKNGDDYDIFVQFEPFVNEHELKITLRPMLSTKTKAFSEIIRFERMALSDLSEFYVLSVSDGASKTTQRMIKIQTEGMPKEREKKVIASMIGDNEQNFYRYIAFLLGEGDILAAMEAEGAAFSSSFAAAGAAGGTAGRSAPVLYEKMLRTAAEAPEKFAEIEKLVQAVSADGAVPKEFEKLYQTFIRVVK